MWKLPHTARSMVQSWRSPDRFIGGSFIDEAMPAFV
jgi:hypothetical protein